MHAELGAKRTVGVHYGTWILSDEHYLAPPRELSVAVAEAKCEGEVMAGQMGRTVVIPLAVAGLIIESSDEASSGSEEASEEKERRELVERRGGKCVIWR